ncbi:MAG: prolipoprotein diacylglyceryl transferase, partial [Candidatus Omnitrophica bacterium]|nr:prolipoprotein diacylglyceryl transferase [Candidatus Omnitrophota bacterium]
MFPILFQWGPVTVYTYGLTVALAYICAAYFSSQAARRMPPKWVAISAEQLWDFTSVILLGGLVGARIFFVGLHWDLFRSSLLEIFALWNGGLVWYGGFIGGWISAWLYTRFSRLDFWRVLDQFIPFAALGHAIGRIGCFLNGCCRGLPSTAWCAVTFPGSAQPVLPTQLFEALGLLVIYGFLRGLQTKGILEKRGQLFGIYLVSYGTLRFLIEFLRGDQSVAWLGLTLQQLISIGLFVIGLFLIARSQTSDIRHQTSGKT